MTYSSIQVKVETSDGRVGGFTLNFDTWEKDVRDALHVIRDQITETFGDCVCYWAPDMPPKAPDACHECMALQKRVAELSAERDDVARRLIIMATTDKSRA